MAHFPIGIVHRSRGGRIKLAPHRVLFPAEASELDQEAGLQVECEGNLIRKKRGGREADLLNRMHSSLVRRSIGRSWGLNPPPHFVLDS